MATCAVILALAVGVSQVLTSRSNADSAAASASSAKTSEQLVNRRAVTVEALAAMQEQNRCVQLLLADKAALQIDVDQAVGVLALANRDPEQIAEARRRFQELAAREDALRPRLANVQADCFDAHPVPTGP